jgi:hypothetical protein
VPGTIPANAAIADEPIPTPLPALLRDVVNDLPEYVSRRRGAELVNRYFFQCGPRAFENRTAWPLPQKYVQARANVLTVALFTMALAKLAAAPTARTAPIPRAPVNRPADAYQPTA